MAKSDQQRAQPVKVLTIAGSDSGGAAGLQADLKTFTVLGAYGMSVVTAVTAQNSVQVAGVYAVPDSFVAAQLDAVLSDYGAAAVKTGYIGRVDIIEVVAAKMKAFQVKHLVVDPILVNHQGQPMFSGEIIQAYTRDLIPLAELVTPNREEAGLLANRPVESLAEVEAAARVIHSFGARWVLVKGIAVGDDAADLLLGSDELIYLRGPRVDTEHTHGSGDMLSAATCVFLAQGVPAAEAAREAHRLTREAIEGGAGWRMGAGHGPVSCWGT